MKAVTARLFAENTLSVKWEAIKNDNTMNGGDKLKKMFYEAIVDENEQKFRRMRVNFQNMPQMLADLVVRQVNDIAHNSIQPVLEQGLRDGSITVPYPKELSEIISLLANVWLNPIVFPATDEEMQRKFEVICGMTQMFGVDVSEMYDAVDNMNKEINKNK